MRRIVHVPKLDDKDATPRKTGEVHSQAEVEVTNEDQTVDYRTSDAPADLDPVLPPAWDANPSVWSVGYEPIGETSIGVEAERKSASQFARHKVPETRLALHQEGRHPSDGDQATRLATLDKKRITQAYCGSLSVPQHLQAQAVRAMLLLDLTAFGNQKRIEAIALLVIELVVDYERRYRRRDPEASRMGEDATFKYLIREAGLVPGKVSLSRKVKSELIDQGFFDDDASGLGLQKDGNVK